MERKKSGDEGRMRERERERGGKGSREERRNVFFSSELKSMCEIRLF